jgi:hypothetical protein
MFWAESKTSVYSISASVYSENVRFARNKRLVAQTFTTLTILKGVIERSEGAEIRVAGEMHAIGRPQQPEGEDNKNEGRKKTSQTLQI